MTITYDTTAFDATKTTENEIRSFRPNSDWTFITELSQGNPIEQSLRQREPNAPLVNIPLNTLTTNGRDLEIKIEWDNAVGGETSKRFYKGWYLNEGF